MEEVEESTAMPPLPKLARTAWRRWPVTAPKAPPPPHLLAEAKVGPPTPPTVPPPPHVLLRPKVGLVTPSKAPPPPHVLAEAKVGHPTPPKVPQPRPKWHQDPKSLRFLIRV